MLGNDSSTQCHQASPKACRVTAKGSNGSSSDDRRVAKMVKETGKDGIIMALGKTREVVEKTTFAIGGHLTNE